VIKQIYKLIFFKNGAKWVKMGQLHQNTNTPGFCTRAKQNFGSPPGIRKER
jgi:hypothetical protein